MQENTRDCCREYEAAARLTRRRFLQGMAATGVAAVTTSVFGDAFRQTTFGATPGGNVLVVISLRGGIDGLGMVVPHGDPSYYAARPTIAVPQGSLVARDELFGLHPRMQPLEWAFTGGELAAVNAVGLAVPNRSHFAAMEEVEDADPGSSARRGWVNRMIGLTRRSQLDIIWQGGATVPIHGAYRSARRTVDVLAPVASSGYQPSPGVTYPRAWPATDLSDALKDTAHLIKADVGTEVVSIDFGSWDMHSDYGTTAWGEMQTMVGGFAGVLDAFLRDLGPELRSRVTVLTISEFGRRIKENGNRGLDHGWGNMMLLAGGGVKGGTYHGRWPGLGDGTQIDADRQVTTDYRNVLGEVITARFPDRSIADVFPGLAYTPLGVMR